MDTEGGAYVNVRMLLSMSKWTLRVVAYVNVRMLMSMSKWTLSVVRM